MAQQKHSLPSEPARLLQKDALAGLRVVEFTVYAAGPMVGKHMAEHGAEVVRVESHTRPDGFRVHYPPFKDDKPGLDRGGTFAIFNNDVLSMTIDLKREAGLKLAKQLVANADVVIENFAQGVIERLGLGYKTLQAINPRLIMLSSCNQGQTGPRAKQRGFGSQLTSMSGFTHLTGYGNNSPPMILYGPYIDFIAVGYGLIAVLAALDLRHRTGKGQHIDLSQYEAGIQFVIPALLDLQADGNLMHAQANRNPRSAPHGAYPCRGMDAWCVISVFSQEEWHSLCNVTGNPDWLHDPRFIDLDARKAHEDELDDLLAAWTQQYSPAEVMEKLQACEIPAAAVNSVGDLFSCPQLAHRSQWQTLRHPEIGDYEYEAPPFLLSETPAHLKRPSPCIGEHNRYVLKEILHLSDEEIEQIETEKILT